MPHYHTTHICCVILYSMVLSKGESRLLEVDKDDPCIAPTRQPYHGTSPSPTHPMIPSVPYNATVPYVSPTVYPATYKQVCSTCRLGTAEAKMRPRGSARGVPTTAGGYGTTGKARCRRWAGYGTW